MALTKEQIREEVEKANHTLISSDNYKNLSSFITVKCDKGHEYVTSVERLRTSSICPECTKEIVKLNGYPPAKKGYRIVSIDQATNVAGVSVFDDGELVYVSTRSFYGELHTRYVDFASFLVKEVINGWKPDELIFEDIQYQNNPQTFKVLGGLLGISVFIAEANKIPHSEVLNVTWQSVFGIKGKNRSQQKQACIAKVRELFGLEVTEDMADSILLGYHKIIRQGKRLF